MKVVRGRCSAAWAVVEYHVTGLKLSGYLKHLLIAVLEFLGPMRTAYHTEMLAKYGVGVEKQLKAVTGIKRYLLYRTVLPAQETGACRCLCRRNLCCSGYYTGGVVLQCQAR